MSNQQIIEYLRGKDYKASMSAVSLTLEKAYVNNDILLRCPNCENDLRVSNGEYKSVIVQYKCKSCGKKYSALTNTIFEDGDYTWDEMVSAVYCTITKQSIEYMMHNVKSSVLKKANAWLLQHKIIHILSLMPQPKLNGVIQIDEKILS